MTIILQTFSLETNDNEMMFNARKRPLSTLRSMQAQISMSIATVIYKHRMLRTDCRDVHADLVGLGWSLLAHSTLLRSC